MIVKKYKITEIVYDTYDEESEDEPFYDEHGYRQSSEQPDPQEMIIEIEGDDEEEIKEIIELSSYVADQISDESGFCVYQYSINEITTEHGYLLSEVRRTVRHRRVPLHGGTLGAKNRARRSKKEILQVWLCHAFQQR